ncbi:MAG: phosphatase PAP2 family protein, partial [Actinomycetota bacterium]
SCALGVESLVVNQGVKRLFRRARPTVSGDDRFAVRTPLTSSFPSGHASSATYAAILLTSFTGAPLVWVWVVLASVVAMSRVVVRSHHFTDIAAGAITGALLGSVALAVSSAIFS